jgi:hypothetical protein
MRLTTRWLRIWVVVAIVGIPTSFASGDKIMSTLPLSGIDGKIDELGTESHIRSERDAAAYIDALLEKYEVDEARLPGLAPLKARLARAEYATIQDPSKRIAERAVAEAFNKIMDRWHPQTGIRVSIEEFHAARVAMSLMVYPNSVSRASNGHVADSCRPVEALYLIYLLESSRSFLPGIRHLLEASQWPDEDLLMEQRKAGRREVRLGTPVPGEFQRDREYFLERTKYLQAHPNLNVAGQIDELFAALGIE